MTRFSRQWAMMAVMTLATSFAGGCGDMDDDDDRRRDDYRETERERDHDDRISRDDRRARDLVPRDAVMVDEGSGSRLRHDPKHDGRAYLYDVDDDTIAYETQLRGGEKLAVDPEKDVVTIDGRRVEKLNLRAKHRYKLYYLRDDTANGRSQRF